MSANDTGPPLADLCLIEGCDAARRTRGMCQRHYQLWHRTGSATRQRRLTHAEVATAAKADTVMALFAAECIPTTIRPEQVAVALGLTVGDLRAAHRRRAGSDLNPPWATKRRKNRTAPVGTKWCPRCESYCQLDQFNRNRTTSDGLQGECGPCQRARQRRPALDESIESAT